MGEAQRQDRADTDGGGRARIGRPPGELLPDATAGRRLKEALEVADLSRSSLLAEVKISDSSLRRWIKGTGAPSQEVARHLAQLLAAPDLAEAWPRRGNSSPEATADETPRPPMEGVVKEAATISIERRGRGLSGRGSLLGVGALVLVVIAVVIAVTHEGGSGSSLAAVSSGDTSTSMSVPSRPGPTQSLPEGAAATLTVDARETSNQMASAISAWTLPSTSTGCDVSPCKAGTRTSGEVKDGQAVAVSCVIVGQSIRNGDPSAEGYVTDDRWLLVAADQDLGQATGQRVWISNIWLARDQLAADLPLCPEASAT
jgi:transcriptional regulator with XRE-family HTH domain